MVPQGERPALIEAYFETLKPADPPEPAQPIDLGWPTFWICLFLFAAFFAPDRASKWLFGG